MKGIILALFLVIVGLSGWLATTARYSAPTQYSAQLDTLYANVDTVLIGMRAVTRSLHGLCIDLARQHQLTPRQAAAYCAVQDTLPSLTNP